MSFRSRSHAKPVAPPRRRSSSLTRPSSASNGYQTTSNGRPYSIHGSTLNSFPLSSQSSGGSANYLYGSNQNLRSGGDYRSSDYGSDYRRNAGYGSVSNGTLKFPMTSMTTSASSYSSPYKDRYSQNYYMNGSNPSSSSTSGYTSAYKDRGGYYNPYTSYENGVTTASFSIPASSVKRDYNPRGSGNLTTSGLGGSSSNLLNAGQAIANLGRSQSLREHERKNRSRKYKEAAKNAVPDSAVPYDYDATPSSLSTAQKSLSSASLHSEGYEVRFSCALRKFFLLFFYNCANLIYFHATN